MILEKLKKNTADFHDYVEQLNFSAHLKNGSITREDYTVLLERLRAFFLQATLLSKNFVNNVFIQQDFFEDKIKLLSADLSASGINYFEQYKLYENTGYYEYLGFCYVSLGSMLGGQVIHRSLSKMQAETGVVFPLMFYQNCKDTVLNEWKTFTRNLQSLNEDHQDAVIEGAKISYRYFIYLCEVIPHVVTSPALC